VSSTRADFCSDEASCCARFGLNEEQARDIRERAILGLIAAGGNVYHLASLMR
jgi:protocatechuate 4,5-dioxygenase alpha chain